MPAAFWTAAAPMATAYATVAAAAVPVGVAARVLARRRGEPLLPRWEPWRVPWGGFEVFAAFALAAVAVPAGVGQIPGLSALAVPLVAAPVQLGLLAVASRVLFPKWGRPRRTAAGYAALLAVAVWAWAVLTPVILAFNAAVIAVFTALGRPVDEHPLVKFGEGSAVDQLLFFVQAGLAAPLIEEVLFRGLLLPWAVGGRERQAGLPTAPVAPPVARPWLVMGFAVFYAAAGGKLGPMIFAAVLVAGMAILWATVRRGKRHVRGVYATAALFGVVHSSVWPSPIPLFLFGLALGWLAVRTRGVLVPAVVHGLFNAVSAVFVLRGAG